ncbi:hypothetical protein CBR_g40113 [Chara braunii]|uniref:Reverse transcriptase domain-containing protein n=1 Tax=Chara braunii TaxID=69332 RepID=A0A388LT80_CHABU|nr:hypothetical protein CBR_g40113 [Chara braunii]|eukprot:GBG85471.1 hypothetical protein CBR_g40113 [Chara braunii]
MESKVEAGLSRPSETAERRGVVKSPELGARLSRVVEEMTEGTETVDRAKRGPETALGERQASEGQRASAEVRVHRDVGPRVPENEGIVEAAWGVPVESLWADLVDAEARAREAPKFPKDRPGYRPPREEEEEGPDRRDLREGRSAEVGGRPRRWVERILETVSVERQALAGQRAGAGMRIPAREGVVEGSRGLSIESRWADIPDARMGEALEFSRDRAGYRPPRREEEGGPSRRDLRDERSAEAGSRPRRWAERESDAAWAPEEVTGGSQGVDAWRGFRGQDHPRWETEWPNERSRYGEDPWGPPRPRSQTEEPDPSWYKPYDPTIDGPMEGPYFRRYDDRQVPYYDVNLGLEALFFDGRDVTGFVEKWKSYAYRKTISSNTLTRSQDRMGEATISEEEIVDIIQERKETEGKIITADRLAKMDIGDGNLTREEREFVAMTLQGCDKAIAFDDSERGRIDPRYAKPAWIHTILHVPWKDRPQWKYAQKEKEEIVVFIKEKIRTFVAEPCESAYSNKWFFLRNGSNNKLRWIQDLQRTNAVTIRDVGSIPEVDLLAEGSASCSIYSIYDLFSGYDEIPLDYRDRHMTAMHTPLRLVQMMVVPMGWTNGVAVFQRAMIAVLKEFIPEKVEVFLDDFPIKGSVERDETEVFSGVRKFVVDHMSDVKEVPEKLDDANLTVSGTKSRWGVSMGRVVHQDIGFHLRQGWAEARSREVGEVDDLAVAA